MKHAIVAAWVLLALAGVAQARDLVQVYDDAVQFDPQIHGADATRMAARESLAAGPGGAVAAVTRHARRSRATKQDQNLGGGLSRPQRTGVLQPLPFLAATPMNASTTCSCNRVCSPGRTGKP